MTPLLKGVIVNIPFTKKNEPNVDTNLAAVHLALSKTDPGTPERKVLLDEAKVLTDMKSLTKGKVSLDTIIAGAFSLGGILTVMHGETILQKVVTSKAFSLIRKV